MSLSSDSNIKQITLQTLREKKQKREPITVLTAYDYPTALALDEAGIDIILVGDSLGMVILGHETTLPVTMEEMLHHCRAVARGTAAAHLVGDMPFLSYQVSVEDAVRNAGRFLKEAGMDAVKLEGGSERARTIEAIIAAGIPVMGHIGLTPQSVHALSGWKTQGKTAEGARRLVEDALVLEKSGCYAVVLEAIPDRVAELITRRLNIPTIGIGAGVGCDGQVLVTHDMLGALHGAVPKFVKKYADLHLQMIRAFHEYRADVAERRFPSAGHSHQINDTEFQELLTKLREPGH